MKNTDPQLQDLRERIAQAQAQPRNHYGPELKREVVAYTAACRSQGATIREIAAELGLSYGVLCTWMRRAKRRQDAGQLPFERILPDALPTQNTASASTAAPDRHDASLSELWLVLRVERMQVENRETLLRWLTETPAAEPSAAAPPQAEHDSH